MVSGASRLSFETNESYDDFLQYITISNIITPIPTNIPILILVKMII